MSLQGPQRLHDSIRGKGSYDLALRGVDNALTEGLPVYIFTVVGRSLLAHLHLFGAELCGALPDIERLTFIQLIRVPGDVFDLSEELLGPDEFITFVQKVALLSVYGLRVDVLNNPLAAVASRVLRMPWVASFLTPVPVGERDGHCGPTYHSRSFDRASFGYVHTRCPERSHQLGYIPPYSIGRSIEVQELQVLGALYE